MAQESSKRRSKIDEKQINLNVKLNGIKTPNTMLSIKNLTEPTDVVIINLLSRELQDFVNKECEKGHLIRYDTASGVGISKKELEKLIITKNENPTDANQSDELKESPSCDFWYRSKQLLQDRGVSIKGTPMIEDKNGNSYCNLKLLLRNQIKNIAKALNCSIGEIQKLLKPIAEKDFMKIKKKEVFENDSKGN